MMLIGGSQRDRCEKTPHPGRTEPRFGWIVFSDMESFCHQLSLEFAEGSKHVFE
jgi:hypothetical protein